MKLISLAPKDRILLRSYLAEMQGVSRNEVSDADFYKCVRFLEEQLTGWNKKCAGFEGIANGWILYRSDGLTWPAAGRNGLL